MTMLHSMTVSGPSKSGRSVAKLGLSFKKGAGSYFGGPFAILCATSIMAFQDAIVKYMSGSEGAPLWQLFVLRSLIIVPILVVFLSRRAANDMANSLNRWVLLRSTLIVFMYVFFFASLTVLKLPIAAAIYYTAPIFIVVFSSIFLRQKPSVLQLFAIFVAFIGVLIVLKPSQDSFSYWAWVPMLSAVCYAAAAVMTNGRANNVSPWALTLSLNIVFIVVGLIGVIATSFIEPVEGQRFLTEAWAPLEARDYLLIGLLAGISIAIHVLLAFAYQAGPVIIVASLDFSYLGFAAIWAFILLAEVPELSSAFGAFLIGASGIWATISNARKKRLLLEAERKNNAGVTAEDFEAARQ